MKAELEPKEIEHRGVTLVAETEEERQVLIALWIDRGRPAGFEKRKDGHVEITIAPSPLEELPND